MNPSLTQSRHILTHLGITLWANRSCATQKVPAMSDGFNPRLRHLLRHPPKDDHPPQNLPPTPDRTSEPVPTPVPEPTPKPSGDQVSQAPAHAHIVPTKPIKLPPPAKPVAPKTTSTPVVAVPEVASVTFHLQGIRYGSWVLMADLYGLDDELMSMWQSLKHALAQHAKNHQRAYDVHEVRHPMTQDDYPEHQHLLPAEGVFLGFLFKLQAGDDDIIASLTPLPTLKQIEQQNLQNVPTLAQMAENTALKNVLWGMMTL